MIRCRTPELMDQPKLDLREHEHALRALNRANRLFGVDRSICSSIRALGGNGRLSVLDVGTGGGGLLGYISDRLNGECESLLLGLDRSIAALTWARRRTGGFHGLAADGRQIPLSDNSVDVVASSLFLHHFDEEDVVLILREAGRVARRGIVIGDLSRSHLALLLTWVTTRILSRSHVFHVDGVRSVRAAYRARELAVLAKRAGLDGARVEGQFPFRLLLYWRKPGGDHGLR